MRFLVYSILFLSMTKMTIANDDDFLMFGDKNFAKEKSEKSKWAFKSGMEYIQYKSSLPEYDGKFETVKKGENHDVFGFGLGIGREFYLGKGISSTFLISGVYQKSLDKTIGKAAEDIDYDLSNIRDANYLYTYEASLSLNYLIDNSVIDVQPFVDFGMGVGYAEVEKEYTKKKEAIADSDNTTEDYDVRTKEDFLFSRIGLGMNFIHFKGLISYVKVSSLIRKITERRTKGSSNLSGTTAVVTYDSKETSIDEIDSLITAQIGMGYMF